jgi:hypothetical protein
VQSLGRARGSNRYSYKETMAQIELRLNPDGTARTTRQSIRNVVERASSIEDPKVRIIQFLRAASGRASIGLGAFYLYLAANHSDGVTTKHSDAVKRATIRYSALWTIALCVRSIFDDQTPHSTRLNAKTLVNASATMREQVAEYWAQNGSLKIADARHALAFVTGLLKRAAIPLKEANKSDCVLTRRIALIKALADRQAAHISLAHYEYSGYDIAHVVAATSIMGAVIYQFDEPHGDATKYLSSLDAAAFIAAADVFPDFADGPRLFADDGLVETLSRLYRGHLMDGVACLNEHLLNALDTLFPVKQFFRRV